MEKVCIIMDVEQFWKNETAKFMFLFKTFSNFVGQHVEINSLQATKNILKDIVIS